MKFSCTQENLSTILSITTPLTGKNLSLPILHNILITAKGSDITIASTNLELALLATTPGKVEKEGAITVNGKLLRDFVALQPSGKLTLELSETDLRVTSSASKTVIKGQSPEDFPVIPTIEDTSKKITLSMGTILQAFQPVLPTVSQSDSRPEISGMLLRFLNNKLIIAGTDSYRLAQYTLPLPAGTSLEGSYILPFRTVQELTRIFSSGEVTGIFTPTQAVFKNDSVELISRLIDGQYPEYEQIIPAEEKVTISINRSEMIQAVKAASLFCRSGINDIELTTKKSEKLLVIAAANNQVGENISTIPAVITGDDVAIVFNYRYVLDALASMPTDDVLLGLNDAKTTGVFHPSDTTPFLHLVMPIRQ